MSQLKEKLGYFYTGIISSDYDSYDLETLKTLGKQGDMRAVGMLGWRFKQEGNYEAALLAYNDAAVLGSTAAGVQLKVLTDNFSPITPLEIKNINKLGLTRYSWLENKRKKMGLSKFNNSVPKYTVEFYLKARKLAGVESVLTDRENPIFLTRTD